MQQRVFTSAAAIAAELLSYSIQHWTCNHIELAVKLCVAQKWTTKLFEVGGKRRHVLQCHTVTTINIGVTNYFTRPLQLGISACAHSVTATYRIASNYLFT